MFLDVMYREGSAVIHWYTGKRFFLGAGFRVVGLVAVEVVSGMRIIPNDIPG